MNSSISKESDAIKNTKNPAYLSRYFFVGMALFLMLFVVLGFGSTYGLQLLLGKEISGAGVVEADWALHMHSVVFGGWVLLLIVQAALIASGKVQKHMAIGKTLGIGAAVAVVISGVIIVVVQDSAIIREGIATWAEWPIMLRFLAGSIVALINFSILFYLGLRNRYQPVPHKRYMFFATITLVIAATSRMNYLLGPDPWPGQIGTFLMVAPIIGYDLFSAGRIHKSTLIGTAIVWGAVIIFDLLDLIG
ncbi:hypothetical protein NC796_24380 [Aliifodinibius sp. S!AR15-10]|uniref:hypothetical protein n=1 Tax=Aliifodinibius sp. S!AR15-10 TaxID=2950437 RepID=UPI00285FD3B7|nr:hypothetical protein [Aliifodinibius sp. S!AR15-10]MDR8394308.1 hypothetical protein [Aliifodinibius sp. S!AR15-10]